MLADPIYGTRANRDYLKQRGIRFAGKPLGHPKQETEANRELNQRARCNLSRSLVLTLS
ncbi:transposase [Methylomonas albis]|uniref:Transposase n=1 Tax=Methylomonas albis TaxID=1854563 RepID=A0ABR9D0N2_9GAMM|nr:transposase [Methylomonas albis]